MDTDEDGFWVGRLDEAPRGAKIFLIDSGNDVVLEVLHRDGEGSLHVMEVDF